MAKQTINVGTSPNDGTGTPLRTAFQYTNSNFSELYTAVGPSGNNIVVPGTATITGDLTVDTNVLKVDTSNNRVGVLTATPGAPLDILGNGLADALLIRGNDNANCKIRMVNSGAGGEEFSLSVGYPGASNSSLVIRSITAGINRYVADQTGAHFWATNAGTAMTLNSTGLGVGVSPSYKIHASQLVCASDPTQNGSAGRIYGAFLNAVGEPGLDLRRWDGGGGNNHGTTFIQTNLVGDTLFYNGLQASNTRATSLKMTLDASGKLLIGTVTSGTAAGDGVVKLGTYGHCISQTGASIASGSSVDLTVVTSGAGYQGFLSVAVTQDASANTRTQTTYSVFGRGTTSTITQIATANGSIGGASFTVTTPSNGVIRITNTSGAAATISAQFFGGASL
jgi:hypothetical protein